MPNLYRYRCHNCKHPYQSTNGVPAGMINGFKYCPTCYYVMVNRQSPTKEKINAPEKPVATSRYIQNEAVRPRFPVTEAMLEDIAKVADKQDDFGFDKYGKPLSSTMNYDWLEMLSEELVDGLKYLQCEKARKELVTGFLEIALENKEWSLVEKSFEILKRSGTGK